MNRLNKLFLLLCIGVILATSGAFATTAHAEETAEATPVVTAQSINVKGQSVTVRANKSKKLTVLSENVESEDIKWTSSDKKVVKVTKHGKIKAIKTGEATVTATVKGTTISDSVTVTVKNPKALYTAAQFKSRGVVKYNGYRWTYYSQKVLPGGGLKIPGRHVENGYVCDKDGYVVLASSDLKKGTIVKKTPFGFIGKVYDCGCAHGTLDVYTNF